ncbi:MAG: DUF3783 domain-containing protein [Clostridium sp.]|nr:DUF3783 domain-containing protein [Clostridium sp.]MCM1547676.1 DUF3783 domain-containing protein [Ruminococcus sp.]
MKSRIKLKENIPPKLVGYCILDSKKDALSEVAKEISTDISFIGKEYAGEKLGVAVGLDKAEQTGVIPNEQPECEVLVMSGLKSMTIDRLLSAMRAKSIIIDLKCTVTPVNRYWEIYRLIDELKKEHEAMHGKNK